MHNILFFEQYLNESLSSYPQQKVIDILQRVLDSDIYIYKEYVDVTIIRIQNNSDSERVIDNSLEQKIKQLGWLVSRWFLTYRAPHERMETTVMRSTNENSQIPGIIKPNEKLTISIEPVKATAITMSTGYHVTLKRNLEKINRQGLKPRSRNTSYSFPDRVFIAKDYKSAMMILPHIAKSAGYEFTDYALLKISNMEELSLHKDPNFIHGVYTYDTVNPTNIKYYTEINYTEPYDDSKFLSYSGYIDV